MTPLLGAVRSEEMRRNGPAVRALSRVTAAKQVSNCSWPLWCRLRSHVGEIQRAAKLKLSISAMSDGLFILPGVGHKLEEVRSELIAAGLPAAFISGFEPHPSGAISARFWPTYVVGLFQAAILRMALLHRCSGKAGNYLNVIFGYAWNRKVLRHKPSNGYWVIIGDLSPFLIGLSAALRREKRKLASWQYGYQDFKSFPTRPDLSFVLNERGSQLAKVDNSPTKVPVFHRKTIDPVPVRFRSQRVGVVGVVLNAFSRPDVFETIEQIQRRLDCRIQVRPHPRDSVMVSRQVPDGVDIRRAGTLEEFCSEVDWVICGNTTSALKIVGAGFPVCQFFGLDHFFEDHFMYGAMGLMPAFNAIEDMSESTIIEFFEKTNSLVRLQELFGRRQMPGIKPLEHLKEFLAATESVFPAGLPDR